MVSIAPFSTPACPDCPQNSQKTVFFACFRFLIFHPFFQGGQLTPFATMCGRPWSTLECVCKTQFTPPAGQTRLNYLVCIGSTPRSKSAFTKRLSIRHLRRVGLHKPEARFTKYLTTILRLSYDTGNAKVTIDLRRTSHSQKNILRRTQGFSRIQFTCKIVKSSEIAFVH